MYTLTDQSQLITKESLISLCFDKVIPRWKQTPETFPDFLQVYTDEDKKINEKAVKEMRPFILSAMPSLLSDAAEEFTERFKKAYTKFIGVERIMHISERLSPEMQSMFEESIFTFIRRIRGFDENIRPESAYQALRNYLIYAIMEAMNTGGLNCRDTVFGFSLLYPYTDNYIDADNRSNEEKKRFNHFVREVILEHETGSSDLCEEKTKQLLDMALAYYDTKSEKHRLTADLLMYMLEAQENSMRQKKLKDTVLTREEILEISVNKGCFSVVIDYLFGIDLDLDKTNERELEFYLNYGLILQLIDDLQDISEDKGISQTLMTSCSTKEELERTVNKLFNFIHSCMAEYTAYNQEMLDFVHPNCELATVLSVMKNHMLFTEEYIKKMIQYAPY